jgi:hypothetical protein
MYKDGKKGPNQESNQGPRPYSRSDASGHEPEGRIIPLNHQAADDDVIVCCKYDARHYARGGDGDRGAFVFTTISTISTDALPSSAWLQA